MARFFILSIEAFILLEADNLAEIASGKNISYTTDKPISVS